MSQIPSSKVNQIKLNNILFKFNSYCILCQFPQNSSIHTKTKSWIWS
jgi:hypothetical protein